MDGAARTRILAWLGSARAQLSLATAARIHSRWDDAERWALRAARAGHTRAHVLLATLYYERNAAGDRRRVFEHNTAAAEAGDPAGMQGLGWCFEQGVGVDVNLESALQWYRAGADHGRVDCQIGVARMLMDGIGAPRDLEAARHYAWLAKQAGAAEADNLLARIARAE